MHLWSRLSYGIFSPTIWKVVPFQKEVINLLGISPSSLRRKYDGRRSVLPLVFYTYAYPGESPSALSLNSIYTRSDELLHINRANSAIDSIGGQIHPFQMTNQCYILINQLDCSRIFNSDRSIELIQRHNRSSCEISTNL